MAIYPEPVKVEGSPSQDTTKRFSGDHMLRKYGFQIEQRKGDTQPKWRWTNGKVYLEEDARYIAIEESKKNVPV